MAFGLTDGTNNGSLYVTNIPSLAFRPDGNYGTDAGTAASGTNPFITGKNIGITTDPTKSGIICEPDSDVIYIIKF